MKNKKTAAIAVSAALCALLFVFYSSYRKTLPVPPTQKTQAQQQTAKTPIKITVSSYVPYVIAKELFKDDAQITMIVPPGSDPHSFEPLPKTVIEIHQGDLFFYTSDAMDPWAKRMSEGKGFALDNNLPAVSKGDPHVWMDFNNMSAMVQNMAMYAAQKYPAEESALVKNAASFQHEINMMDRLYGKMLAQCKTRDIYHIGHMAFGYTAKDYNLNFKPLVGATSDQEPSAKDMAQMIKQIKDNKADYIFTEETINPALAKTIADATGAKILTLYPVEHITKADFDKGVSYRQFMMANLENLSEGLGCAKAD